MLSRDGVPGWVIALAVILALPVFQEPMLLASCPPDPPMVRTLVWIYPAYVIVAAWLGCACWARRRVMTWILFGLLLLTHIGVYMLVTQDLN